MDLACCVIALLVTTLKVMAHAFFVMILIAKLAAKTIQGYVNNVFLVIKMSTEFVREPV